MPRVLVPVLGLLTACGGWAATPREVLRLHAIQPETFDFVFASVITGSDGAPVLAFTGRDGTRFLKVGETLGDYTLTAYAPATNRVFNPSVNTWLTVKGGVATLASPTGGTLKLEQGKPKEGPNWRAMLLRPDTADTWILHAGNSFAVDGTSVELVSVTSTSVIARTAGETFRVPFLTAEEKERFRVARAQRQGLVQPAQPAGGGGTAGGGASEVAAAPPPALPPVLDVPHASFGGTYGGSKSIEMRSGYGLNPFELYPPQLYYTDENGKPRVMALRPGANYDVRTGTPGGVTSSRSGSSSSTPGSGGFPVRGSAAPKRKPLVIPGVTPAPR
jgi:hypothetical protein